MIGQKTLMEKPIGLTSPLLLRRPPPPLHVQPLAGDACGPEVHSVLLTPFVEVRDSLEILLADLRAHLPRMAEHVEMVFAGQRLATLGGQTGE